MPGEAKTRLTRLLGPEGAAQLQAALLCDAVRKLGGLRGVVRYLFFSGRAPSGWVNFAGRLDTARYVLVPQQGADLGERLERAFCQLLGHHPSVLVMGTDSPALDAQRLRQALDELSCCEAVLGPCPDGGYYLIALRRSSSGLFRGVRWGTEFAFQDTLRNLMERRFSCSVLEALPDIDRPADFRRLAKSLSLSSHLRRLAPATWSFVRRTNDRTGSSSDVRFANKAKP